MDTLRWILLACGALVVIGVYFWSRQRAAADDEPFVRTEPGMGTDEESVDPLFASPPAAPAEQAAAPNPEEMSLRIQTEEPDMQAVQRELHSLQTLLQAERPQSASKASAAAAAADGKPAPREEKLLVMYVVAPAGRQFSGHEVATALQAAQLRYGEMQIYHRYPDAGGETPIFSVANLVEPGILEPKALAKSGTPGLTLFLQLPGPLSALAAFDLFAAAAEQIAQALGGELRDQSRSAMSRQTLVHLRDDVQHYERRLRLPRQA